MKQDSVKTGVKKFEKTLIFGSSAVEAYDDNPNISKDELLDLGDVVTISFDTKEEMDAYIKGVNHAIDWNDVIESNNPKHNYNPTPAPIDNKNVLEDFAEVFHNGDCIERVENKIHQQLFYFDGKPFELFYVFGMNHFHLCCMQKVEDMELLHKVRSAVEELNGGNIHVIYSDDFSDNRYSLSAMFYFNED